MRPDEATLRQWTQDYENAPKAFLDEAIHGRLSQTQAAGLGTSINLLDYLQYKPEERNQGSCSDCWVWAGTGILEIALDVQNDIMDRLSTQFMNSCKTDKFACCGGNLTTFSSWYAGKGYAIPWDNSNGFFQDVSTGCQDNLSFTSCGSISTNPNYPITQIQAVTIPTQGVGQSTAVSNIKNVLHQEKAVWYSFCLPSKADWDKFKDIWLNYDESTVWNPDPYCGDSWVSNEGGCHAVVIVGYDDEAPNTADHYWIILNSWGTANGNRPNGLFRVPMYINYDCSYSGNKNYKGPEIMTLNVTFNPSAPPVEKPNLKPYKPQGWSDQIVVSNATGTTTDSSPLLSTDTLYVNFAVINDSDVAINSTFYVALYVDNTLENTWSWDSLDAHYYGSLGEAYSIGSLSAGTHSIKIAADSSNAIDENNETDNVYTKTITVQGPSTQKPNLTPYQPQGWSDKIVVSNVTGATTDSSPFKTTDTLYVNWAVINNGPVNISNHFYVSLYVDGAFKNSWYIASLNANVYFRATNYAIGLLGAGTHTLMIFADSNQEISESNEADNKYTKTITVQDPNPGLSNLTPYQPSGWSDALVVSTSKGSLIDSSSITVEDNLYIDWAVLNNGPVATPGGFSVELYIDGFLENIWSLSSGLKSNYYWSVKGYSIGSLYPGDHLLELLVDSGNVISESDEEDNYYEKWVTVEGSYFDVALPNLRPYQPEGWLDKMVIYTSTKTFTDSPSFTNQDPLYVDWAVINDGQASTSKPFSVNLSVDGIFKKSWTVPRLNGSGVEPLSAVSSMQKVYYAIKHYSVGKLGVGDHTFTIVIDPKGVIREEDKEDNEYHKTIQVLGGP